MNVLNIRVEDIEIGERHRALSEDAVDRLIASMREIGLMQPISIRIVDEMMVGGELTAGVPLLVAGAHRLAAARALDWSHIDCIEIDDNALLAELWEIDENLIRSELTPAQQAGQLARRKDVWEELRASGKIFPTKERFAAATAKATGETKRNINLQVARAEALGPDLRVIAGTSLDKGVEMDALAKMPAEQRAPIIQRAVAGEQVSARAPLPDHDVVVVQFNSLMAAWNRAGPEARDMFLAEIDGPVFDRTAAAR